MTASAARGEKDAAARNAKARQLFSQVSKVAATGVPHHAIYPGFGPKPGADLVALPVPKRAIVALTEKIVRGITYLQDGRFIEPPHKIDVYALTEQSAIRLKEALAKYGEVYERGPALLVERAVASSDDVSAVFRIEIWSRLRSYAIVSDPSADAAA